MEEDGPGWLGRLKRELAFVRGNLLVLTVSWTIWSPFSHAVGVYEQVYIMALGASVFLLGLMSAVSSVILGIVRFLGGYVADRYGRKRILVSMTFVYSLALFLYALAPDWRWIFVASVITSICLLYQPALSAILMDSVPPERRGLGFSLSNLLPELVSLPAPFLAMYLVGTHGLVAGMRIAYSLMAISGLMAALVRLKLKETWSPRKEAMRDFLSGYKDALRFASEELRPFMVILGLVSLLAGFNTVTQPFVIYYLGLTLDEWGLLYFLGSVIWITALLPAGAIVDRLGRRSSLIAGLFLTSLSLVALSGLKSLGLTAFWHVAPSMLLLWTSSYLAHNALSALEADLVPRGLRGRLSAFLALLTDVVAAVSSATCGWLYETVSPSAAALLCSLSALAGAIMASLALREPEERQG